MPKLLSEKENIVNCHLVGDNDHGTGQEDIDAAGNLRANLSWPGYPLPLKLYMLWIKYIFPYKSKPKDRIFYLHYKSFENTVGKEKLLVTSNFSFSQSVFYTFGELSAFFYQILNCRLQTLSVWKSLKFVIWERVKRSGDDKIFIKPQYFRLVQIERISRRPKKKFDPKIEIYSVKGRKHCGKCRKCWLPAFSPFPTVFSKGFCLKVIKSRDCEWDS